MPSIIGGLFSNTRPQAASIPPPIPPPQESFGIAYQNTTGHLLSVSSSSGPVFYTDGHTGIVKNNHSYDSLELKEYSVPVFVADETLLPKVMVPHAVMCPKADIRQRVTAYLK